MNNHKFLNVSVVMVLLAWLTFPFLGTRTVKRYLPASIITVLIELINVPIGKHRKWWVFYRNPNSILSGEIPFIIGPFLLASLWILKFSFGHFKRFLFLNLLLDGTFAFLLSDVAKKIKLFTLVRLNKFQFFLYFFSKAFLLYGVQYILETRKIKEGSQKYEGK